jgi:drug/metabolite transporter (DMT)-like permease
MLLGGMVLLILSWLSGEPNLLPGLPLRAGVALFYLIVGGSLVAFTAFVWLLGRMPASRVASHAYVNPVVAVALGYFAAGEELTLRTILASTLILFSVILILRANPSAVK